MDMMPSSCHSLPSSFTATPRDLKPRLAKSKLVARYFATSPGSKSLSFKILQHNREYQDQDKRIRDNIRIWSTFRTSVLLAIPFDFSSDPLAGRIEWAEFVGNPSTAKILLRTREIL